MSEVNIYDTPVQIKIKTYSKMAAAVFFPIIQLLIRIMSRAMLVSIIVATSGHFEKWPPFWKMVAIFLNGCHSNQGLNSRWPNIQICL